MTAKQTYIRDVASSSQVKICKTVWHVSVSQWCCLFKEIDWHFQLAPLEAQRCNNYSTHILEINEKLTNCHATTQLLSSYDISGSRDTPYPSGAAVLESQLVANHLRDAANDVEQQP